MTIPCVKLYLLRVKLICSSFSVEIPNAKFLTPISVPHILPYCTCYCHWSRTGHLSSVRERSQGSRTTFISRCCCISWSRVDHLFTTTPSPAMSFKNMLPYTHCETKSKSTAHQLYLSSELIIELMSDSLPNGMSIAEYQAFTSSFRVLVATTVLYCYDWSLTLGQEVHYMWCQKWGLPTWIFISSRYATLLSMILQLLPTPTFNR
ncbi:hypothetical protein BC629DRAFT_1104565 [Irpex lacteus]|nr:hypothetical protein BC629DRAFT_1104565 [Irpex lacteus]